MTTNSPTSAEPFKYPLAYRLAHLPDVLLDHSLGEAEQAVRIGRYFVRWVGFIDRLGGRRLPGRPTVFALRYFKCATAADIEVYFMARPAIPAETFGLDRFVTNALATEGIPAAKLSGKDATGNDKSYEKCYEECFIDPVRKKAKHIAEVIQAVRDADVDRSVVEPSRFDSASTEAQVAAFGRTLPWRGPAGAFRWPIDTLMACRTTAAVTILLSPTELSREEDSYLWAMAQGTSSRYEVAAAGGETIRRPIATEFTAQFASNARRLANPFEVAVHCMVVADPSDPAANAAAVADVTQLAWAFQSVIAEPPDAQTFGEDMRSVRSRIHVAFAEPPHDADAADVADEQAAKRRAAYNEAMANYGLGFHRWATDWRLTRTDRPPLPQHRVQYLVDAIGAATVFRLPLNLGAGIPGITFRQPSPQTYGDFAPKSPSDRKGPERAISIGLLDDTQEELRLGLNSINQHCLIVGFTGSGKSTSIKHILRQLWAASGPGSAFDLWAPQRWQRRLSSRPHRTRVAFDLEAAKQWRQDRVPFLVLESAKAEYRHLLTEPMFYGREPLPADNGAAPANPQTRPWLRVFTLGNDAICPFRLNPFEVMPGIRVESHASRLLDCFMCLMTELTFASSMLAEALEAVYLDAGWLPTQLATGGASDPPMPTLALFYRTVKAVVEARKYGQNSADVAAAIVGRVKRLCLGSLGTMLNVARSFPFRELFDYPTILEMNSLGEQDKQFASMLVLLFLREYREANESQYLQWKKRQEDRDGRTLWHVTVVEEAHNVFSRDTGQATSEDKRRTVQSFCNLLAEIRSFGEGVIVADQSPSKLALDAIRNTNVQIAHARRDKEDREAVARAMIMTAKQEGFIGKLRTAGLFTTGFERAAFFDMAKPPPETWGYPRVC
jgi:hypothetical protein